MNNPLAPPTESYRSRPLMLAKETLIADIRKGLAVLQHYVRPGGRINLTDGNVQSESVVEDLLNQVYGWNVTSTNKEKANYPCIDLIDAGRKLGIQVTAEKDSDKANDTLTCLDTNKMSDRVAHLKVLLIVPKQKKYTINVSCPGVSFDWETDVVDFDDVLVATQAISNLQHLGRVQQCIVNAMPTIFPQYLAPRTTYCIRTHQGTKVNVPIVDCDWYGPVSKPIWLNSSTLGRQ